MVQAKKDIRTVGLASDDELRIVFNNACFKVGLNATHWPLRGSASETLIFSYLRESHSSVTLQEFTLAFTMAIDGALEVDINHYQTLSPEYLSRILRAYRTWVDEAKWKPLPAAPLLPAPSEPVDDKTVLRGQFNLYKTGKLPWKDIDRNMYGIALGLNQWAEKHWITFASDVRQAITSELQAQALVEPQKKAELEKVCAKILQGHYGARIEELSKKWSVKVWFDNLIANTKNNTHEQATEGLQDLQS